MHKYTQVRFGEVFTLYTTTVILVTFPLICVCYSAANQEGTQLSYSFKAAWFFCFYFLTISCMHVMSFSVLPNPSHLSSASSPAKTKSP